MGAIGRKPRWQKLYQTSNDFNLQGSNYIVALEGGLFELHDFPSHVQVHTDRSRVTVKHIILLQYYCCLCILAFDFWWRAMSYFSNHSIPCWTAMLHHQVPLQVHCMCGADEDAALKQNCGNCRWVKWNVSSDSYFNNCVQSRWTFVPISKKFHKIWKDK